MASYTAMKKKAQSVSATTGLSLPNDRAKEARHTEHILYPTVYNKFTGKGNKSMFLKVITVSSTMGWGYRGCSLTGKE